MEKPTAEKRYLYHMVPNEVKTGADGRAVLHPLNQLKKQFPGLYEVATSKYKEPDENDSTNNRPNLMETLIPTLENAAWGDVLHLTAIPPADLKKALIEAGYQPEELKFYQIDPSVLDPRQMTVFLYREDLEDDHPDNFATFDAHDLHSHAVVPESTKKYYSERFKKGQKPLLFVGVPHIFHKGPIDVSNLPVIVA